MYTSYLQNSYFYIKINNEYSFKQIISHGVQHGSVLGPKSIQYDYYFA